MKELKLSSSQANTYMRQAQAERLKLKLRVTPPERSKKAAGPRNVTTRLQGGISGAESDDTGTSEDESSDSSQSESQGNRKRVVKKIEQV